MATACHLQRSNPDAAAACTLRFTIRTNGSDFVRPTALLPGKEGQQKIKKICVGGELWGPKTSAIYLLGHDFSGL